MMSPVVMVALPLRGRGETVPCRPPGLETDHLARPRAAAVRWTSSSDAWAYAFNGQNDPVTVGVQFPPPTLVSQLWYAPVAESMLVDVVVGVKVRVPLIVGSWLPLARVPMVMVRVVLVFVQAQVML
jgi:hypothetical protein